MSKYTFDEKKHIHTLDGKALTGVTTVLGIIAKPFLIPWAAKMTVEWIRANSKKVESTYLVTEEDLEKAKAAHRKTKEEAGDKGKDIHSIIEVIIKDAIKNNGGLISPITDKKELLDNKQITDFVKWAIENNIKFLESEKNVYSKVLWIGGICDFVFERYGEIFVGDIKTGKSIDPMAFWQTSAYQYCLQEMGLYPKIKGFCIVRLGKDNSFEAAENYAFDDNISGFTSALNIYRKLNLIK